MKKAFFLVLLLFSLLAISTFAQETWNSYIITFEDTFINAIDFLFGSNEFSIAFLKFAAWVILFSFLTKGFERIFYSHKLLAVLASLLVSVIGIRLIPEVYFEISTPLMMWFAIATILIGAPYALLTVFRVKGRLRNFLWFVAVLGEIFYLGQLGDLGYAFRSPVFYNLTYIFGKYWELVIIALIVIGVAFFAGKGNKSFTPAPPKPAGAPVVGRPQDGAGWGKAFAAAMGIDFLKDLLLNKNKRDELRGIIKSGAQRVGAPVQKSWGKTKELWSMQCNSCGAPLNKGPKCNNCGTPYPWRDRWRSDKEFEKKQNAVKRIEERIKLLDRMIEDAYYLANKNPDKYNDVKIKIARFERERRDAEQSLSRLLGN